MIIVETESTCRKAYIFNQGKDGQIYLLHGLQEYLLASLPEICLGKPMKFSGRKLNMMTEEPSDLETYFVSTPVVSVKM